MTQLRWPELRARALNGTERLLPRDLPADRTLVLLPFRQAQQRQVDEWMGLSTAAGCAPDLSLGSMGLGDASHPVATIEVPCLGRRWAAGRRFIDGGMASSIGVPEVLARTWTSYTDVAAVQRSLRVPDSHQMWAFVVQPDGLVLERAAGAPTSRSWERIQQVLTAG